jgi:hypothetical protein
MGYGFQGQGQYPVQRQHRPLDGHGACALACGQLSALRPLGLDPSFARSTGPFSGHLKRLHCLALKSLRARVLL